MQVTPYIILTIDAFDYQSNDRLYLVSKSENKYPTCEIDSNSIINALYSLVEKTVNLSPTWCKPILISSEIKDEKILLYYHVTVPYDTEVNTDFKWVHINRIKNKTCQIK